MLAIVLSRTNFREYDQVISLYTQEFGKRECLARGIKKMTSKNAAALLPFSLLELEIVPCKEIDHMTSAQPIRIFTDTIHDLDKISIASYAGKIANEFILPNEKDEEIFSLLLSFLDFVNSVEKINSLNLATGFILKLWQCFGFGEEEKYGAWLKDDWIIINSFQSSEVEQKEIYAAVCKYAEFHSGKKLARLFSVS